MIRERFTSGAAPLLAGCLAMALMKLVLVGNEEIIARAFTHDDLWHLQAALRGYWLGSDYTQMAFIHLPVYSLYVGLVYFTGIPLRIATELLYLAGALFFAWSLFKAGWGRGVCAAAYALMVFNPASFQLFNYSLAEMLYAPLFLLALGSLILLWVNREGEGRFRYGMLTGLFFALLWYTRKESILLAGLLALTFALAVCARPGRLRLRLRRAFSLFLPPLFVILLVSALVLTLNYRRFGLVAATEMTAPGYSAAYKALLRIRPAHPLRFVPVTTEVRRAAYRVSPAFRELEPYLERDGYPFSETRTYMKIDGEIAAGWFYWALRDAAALAGHHRSAQEADAYYRRVAGEINGAIDAGRLPGRGVYLSFLDPEPANYLPHLPASFARISRVFLAGTPPGREADSDSPPVRALFDLVCNRRGASTPLPVVAGPSGNGSTHEDHPRAARERLQRLAWQVHGPLVTGMSALGFVSLVALLLRRKVNLRDDRYPILAILFGAVAGRVLLFTLLDASAWPGDQARYLFPAMPVYSSFLLLLLLQGVGMIGRSRENV